MQEVLDDDTYEAIKTEAITLATHRSGRDL